MYVCTFIIALRHASSWCLAVKLWFVYVFESVDHLKAHNTFKKIYCKIVLNLDILHSHYGYNITARGETDTVIPISYDDFRLNFSLKHRFQWISHIIQYIWWSESTFKSQTKGTKLADKTAKGISSPRLYGASEHPQDYSLCLRLCGTHGGAVGQRRIVQIRLLDINWNTSNMRRVCPLQEDLCGHA